MDTLTTAPPVAPRDTPRPTTMAAEGLPRWRWTTEDVIRLSDLGVFEGAGRFELLGGEIVPIAATGRRHALVAEAIDRIWKTQQEPDVSFGEQKQFNLDSDTYTEPDLLVWPQDTFAYDIRGPESLLVVEVSDTTLQTDLGYKRQLYARFGVREYWVVNAWELTTRVHREPTSADYRSVVDVAASVLLTPHLAPRLCLRLADLKL